MIPEESNYSHDPREYAHQGYDDEDDINVIPNVEHIPTQEILQPTTNTEEALTTKEMSRGSASIIWQHFTKQHLEGNDYNLICNHCKKVYRFTTGSGYGTYRRHLASKHPTEFGIDTRQQQIPKFVDSNTSNLFRYDRNNYEEELAKFTVVEHLAFNFGENFGFNTFVQNACTPQAKSCFEKYA